MLNELAKQVHQMAVEHGWWEKEPSFPEIVAMCHSELSEALQSYRNEEEVYRTVTVSLYKENRKPEGVAVEMADCMIRILDWFGYMNLDVDAIVQAKMNYNKTRPYKHGGKLI